MPTTVVSHQVPSYEDPKEESVNEVPHFSTELHPASSVTQPAKSQSVSTVTHPTEPAEVVQALSNMEGKAVDVITSEEDCTLHQVSGFAFQGDKKGGGE